MDKARILEELKRNSKKIRFKRLCTVAEVFGFRFKGGRGSHRIYVRDGIDEMLNFQNVSGKVKPYQVKQLIKIIEKYNLLKEDERDV
ncbi:MAG: hypothetical protein EMLJLAPB_00062 [Candidatus Argoarchaeum ethanivorans]|uniref:Type II toxin-antitoxin system HicA family toxin n=1 Tax=Candidatus Argoarchaeum ethanivorans TaxID=2608793 RepID=A0A811T0J3_9EURY|nr:MAG: hypothetical protein KFBDDELM_00164 [Candidatus Argoarchaeum ethanivorans]CAD6490980.1 MAG: hypothetical protein EMLJLAPB_00062 [Candidatus Argoarchaeum ethanivorans]CAD6492235.1 MAG: hypothetical protein FFODKBPE_00288 [Candidatus Argoarchaeum ethanivorans]